MKPLTKEEAIDERLLGVVRKEENKLENRMYFPKSEKYKNNEKETDKIDN